jgi:hypothetical protein
VAEGIYKIMKKSEFEAAVKNVFDACRQLSKISGNLRLFTSDGKMGGDIGEVAASIFHNVKLGRVGRHHWDGTLNDKDVQINATSGDITYVKKPPEEGFGDGILMVFKIDRKSGGHKLIYNGEIQRVWDALEKKNPDKVGDKFISLKDLDGLKSKPKGYKL